MGELIEFTPEFVAWQREDIKTYINGTQLDFDFALHTCDMIGVYYPAALDEIERLREEVERHLENNSVQKMMFEKCDIAFLRINILRLWPREKIIHFATHLLGTDCQLCRAGKLDGHAGESTDESTSL